MTEEKPSVTEAQDEANLVSAQLSKGGRERELTAQDYDKALLAIEELKRAAAKNPDSLERTLMALAREAEEVRYAIACLIDLSRVIHLRFFEGITGDIPDPVTDNHERIMDRLDTATERLKQLKEEAQKLEWDY